MPAALRIVLNKAECHSLEGRDINKEMLLK